MSGVSSRTSVVRIALTREIGKNSSLRDALSASLDNASCVELPCVETVPGPDSDMLANALVSRAWSWIVITSPESASIFCSAWRAVGSPKVRVAAVGKATSRALTEIGVRVACVPQTATGKALVAEMPGTIMGGKLEAVLYPASDLAPDVVPRGLRQKGYTVVRLNTHSTKDAEWDQKCLEYGEDIDVVTFAATCAVKGWVKNAGVNVQLRVACMGETSRDAAVKAGFPEDHVFYPAKPGMDGWVSAVEAAIHNVVCD
jgi:uroporphyrinogen-III synthase